MPPPELDQRERKILTAEIIVVIALGILPHMASVIYGWSGAPPARSARTAAYSLYGVSRNLQIILPLIWIMFRSGRGWRYYGLVRVKPLLDIPIAVLFVVALYIVGWSAELAFNIMMYAFPATADVVRVIGENSSALKSMRTPTTGVGAWAALTLYMVSNGFGEELVLRGYLLPRIRELSQRPVLSAFLVSGVAAAYHLYQGSHNTLIIFVGQLIICWIYAKVPRVVPFAIGHAVYDLLISVLWSLYPR